MSDERARQMGEWLDHLRDHRVSRREALRTAGRIGFGALAAASLTRLSPGWSETAEAAQSATIVSWAPAGQRWEFPQKGVYPLFQKKFPDIKVEFTAEPIADMLPKTAVAMSAKSDRYDLIHEDYNLVPQFIAEGALAPIEGYLDKDPAFKADILSDIPENVMDLYRDKPAKEGGKLYGLPPDSNCQFQYYRADVLEKAPVRGRPKEVVGLEEGGAVPAGGHAGRQQRLDLGGQVQRAAVGRVVEGLDAEAIPGGEERVVGAIPEHEGELAAQVAQAGRAVVFVQVQGYLAVGAGAEAVAPAFEVTLRALEVVELAVDDDVQRLILASDRLGACRQVDDAEPGVAQPDPLILAEPCPLSVRAAVGESACRSLQGVGRNRLPRRIHRDDTAHAAR